MGLFDFIKNSVSLASSEPEPRTLKTVDYVVAGTQYYLKNINKLAVSNKDYKSAAKNIIESGQTMTPIFQYTFVDRPVKLEPEPANTHDKNAVKVIIAGEHVGYIPATSCIEVKTILKKNEIKYISAYITGGKYKLISANGDIEKSENDIKIKIRIGYV